MLIKKSLCFYHSSLFFARRASWLIKSNYRHRSSESDYILINKDIVDLLLSFLNCWYQWVLYIRYITYSHCKVKLKNMLVCHHPSLLLWVHTTSQIFFSFLDGKDNITYLHSTYLLNLSVFECFTSLHFLCLVLLQCTCDRHEFSLLYSRQSAI